MAGKETPDHPGRIVLPPLLREFLADQPTAALLHSTNRGTALIVKLPDADITSLAGPVPIHLGYALYDHPAAPVLRLVMTIFDQPDQPLALESFLNLADDDQRAELAALGRQPSFSLHFFNENLDYRLSKRVRNGAQPEVAALLAAADWLRRRIPADQFDFERAKQAVMEARPL